MRYRGLIGALAAGAALRVFVLRSESLGALDADEAVVGLMARRVLDGEFTTFYWGQSYGGTLEPLLVAGVFAVLGSGTLALKLVPMLLFALATVLVWVIARRVAGNRAATVAAFLFATWPAYVVWWSTKERGFYGVTLVLGLCIVLLALRLNERPGRRDVALLGAAAGLGWWTNPMIAFLALPSLAWLVWRRTAVLRHAWLGVAAFTAAAAPWLVSSLQNDWQALNSGPPGGGDSYLDHLRTFFGAALPMSLGIRVPYSLEWLTGALVGRVVEGAAVGSVAWAMLRRRSARLEPLLVLAVAYPFLYALAPVAWYSLEPRYLYALAPVTAVLVAVVAARSRWLAVSACATAAALSVAGVLALEASGGAAPYAHGRKVPADLSPVVDLLDRNGVDRVRASYWIAYRITFETDERIVAASTDQSRYEPYQALVAGGDSPAEIFVRGARDEAARSAELVRSAYRRIALDGWIVYLPPRRQQHAN